MPGPGVVDPAPVILLLLLQASGQASLMLLLLLLVVRLHSPLPVAPNAHAAARGGLACTGIFT
jgi:hypothetical protein